MKVAGNTAVQSLKDRANRAVDSLAPTLVSLSLRIHANPELAFKEFEASAALCDTLEDLGYAPQRAAYGLETAFAAEFGSAGPYVALLSEFDALPQVGHACGHNIIAVTGLGASLALASLGGDLPGRVRYLGTPAEEDGGGKELMARRGAFDGVDCAMMVHPSTEDVAAYPLLAVNDVTVRYHGRAAHAASCPEVGLNALDALVSAYQAISALRQHVPAGQRIHGIISNGGAACNVVPDLAEGHFAVRAPTLDALRSLQARVNACLEAGALATGTRAEICWNDVAYADMRTNWPLAKVYQHNAEGIGRTFERFEDIPIARAASSDMGNVSHRVPSIHPMIAMAPKGTAHHHRDFAVWSASDEAMRAAIDGAKALAMTAIDFMTDADLRQRVGEAFLGAQANQSSGVLRPAAK
ncbi:M20 family metallopeptidase [Rhizobium sp. A37_96]